MPVPAGGVGAPLPFATVQDVAARWRALSDAEKTLTTTLLADASAVIRAKVPDVDTRIGNGKLDPALPRLVTVNMVLRVLRNPRAIRSETVGPYSATYDPALTGGFMVLTADELALLAAPVTVNPAATTATVPGVGSIALRPALAPSITVTTPTGTATERPWWWPV